MRESNGELFSLESEISTVFGDAGVDDRNRELFLSAVFGFADLIHATVAKGADVNIRDSRGRTPLMLAVLRAGSLNGRFRRRGLGIVRALLAEGAAVNVRDTNGDTALSLALRFNRKDIAHILLAHGANSA